MGEKTKDKVRKIHGLGYTHKTSAEANADAAAAGLDGGGRFSSESANINAHRIDHDTEPG